jgi:hypothetical protein
MAWFGMQQECNRRCEELLRQNESAPDIYPNINA